MKDEPDAIKTANEDYKFDMDSVGVFILDCFEIDATNTWRLTNKLLYETYCKWCNENNEKIMSQKWLAMRMQKKGFKRMVSNSQRFWLGLVVKKEWE